MGGDRILCHARERYIARQFGFRCGSARCTNCNKNVTYEERNAKQCPTCNHTDGTYHGHWYAHEATGTVRKSESLHEATVTELCYAQICVTYGDGVIRTIPLDWVRKVLQRANPDQHEKKIPIFVNRPTSVLYHGKLRELHNVVNSRSR